jgi:hypothetical protein
VYIDPDSGNVCQCEEEFSKTCPLKAANNLKCKEAIVSVTFIERDTEVEKASESIRALDPALKTLRDPLRDLVSKLK